MLHTIYINQQSPNTSTPCWISNSIWYNICSSTCSYHPERHTGITCKWKKWMRLQRMKKRWAGALLSVKCSCFAWRPLWKSHVFELACLKKKGKKKRGGGGGGGGGGGRGGGGGGGGGGAGEIKKNHFGRLVTFWFGTFTMLFHTTGRVVLHENTQTWMVGCYKGL